MRISDWSSDVCSSDLPLQGRACLLHHADEGVPREEWFDTVWAGRPTVDNVLANAVAKLRKAFGPVGHDRIVNLPRVGYRLCGPVERTVSGRRLHSRLDLAVGQPVPGREHFRSEEHTSELQSLMRISYAVFCLKKKKKKKTTSNHNK